MRKTRDEYQLLVNYGQGWEHEVSEDTRAEINQRRKEYTLNCPQYSTAIRVKRIKL